MPPAPAPSCTICQPPVPFPSRNALVHHRATVHGALPQLCGKDSCEQAFATNGELQKHWNENHTKCDRCNRVLRNPAGLKLHQKKCLVLDTQNPPSFQSIDSGVASDKSKDSRASETSSASSSLRSNESRHQVDNAVTVEASLSKQITPNMRHAMFGLSTASAALIFAHERGIGNVDEDALEKILKGGQKLFEVYATSSDCGGPNGSVSLSPTQGPFHVDLWDVSLTLTYSPEEVPNPAPKFVGRLNRNKLFKDLASFSKQLSLGVLQVGEFYMALVYDNNFLYVFNPGIGTSNELQGSSGRSVALMRVKKCHRRGWHVLVDDLIESFKLEINFSDEPEYVIMPAFISYP